ENFKDAIPDLYARMDDLLGDARKKLRDDDVLMVISDHGFKQFKWGVNLNSWLWREGLLALKEGASPGGVWFKDVDWTRTRAYGYGLAGIFFNVRGREKYGVVGRGKERAALAEELKEKLEALRDEARGQSPIRSVHPAREVYHGPYVNDAPDLLVGCAPGYRVSWNSAVGKITDEMIEENTKSWSGDHCVDPKTAPGVFFSNWKMEASSPSLVDLAPTILNLFGIEKQKYHDGNVLPLTPGDGGGGMNAENQD
ncbi:MAG: nucleotide pyrophosphatase, partial [Desulfobacterales bacterium]|nr:nucleotide pyrophosphatase [Desulfobacterales bacterium]